MWQLLGGSCYRGQAGAVAETRGCCYGIPARSRYGFPLRSTCSRYGNHSHATSDMHTRSSASLATTRVSSACPWMYFGGETSNDLVAWEGAPAGHDPMATTHCRVTEVERWFSKWSSDCLHIPV